MSRRRGTNTSTGSGRDPNRKPWPASRGRTPTTGGEPVATGSRDTQFLDRLFNYIGFLLSSMVVCLFVSWLIVDWRRASMALVIVATLLCVTTGRKNRRGP